MPRLIALAVLSLLAWVPGPADAQRGTAKQTTYALIRCESPGGRESFCPADTQRGVRLVNALSGRCQIGRNWGYDAEGIWVRGCSAEFEIGQRGDGYGWGWGHNEGASITCASQNYRYTLCDTETRGGVRLVNQISRAECVEGRSWGYDRRGVWVDQGCAGEFEVGGGGGDYRPGGGDRPGGGYDDASGATFVCESRDGRRRYCEADLRGGSVAVVRNISREPCQEGVNYGVDGRGVWVDRGCRAEFRIVEPPQRPGRPGRPGAGGYPGGGYPSNGGQPQGGSYPQGGTTETVRCESKDYKRRTCGIGEAYNVSLRRQLSKSACVEGATWGWDRSGIWVDRGCGAEFAVER